MNAIEIIFWVSLGLITYTYLGYGVVVYIFSRFRKPPVFIELNNEDLPEITHVIAAYNEEDLIEEKILNCYKLDYPKSKIHTVIVADGSTDKTVDIVMKYPFVELLYSPERRGKLAAVERVMKQVNTGITVFSDANSMLNSGAINEMVKHFQDPKVGAVAGEKVVISEERDDAASAGEGIYWKYESLLKRLDYRLHSVVGAAGELFAVRTDIYEKPAKNALIEDFIITMRIAEKGYRVAYEPKARAHEYASANIQEELKRKVRISAGGVQSVWMLKGVLNPFKHGILSWQYVSHRAIRWTLAPLSLLIFLLTNIILGFTGSVFYSTLLMGQLLFYALAWAGYEMEKREVRVKAIFIPFYFTFMNVSVFLGLFRLMSGKFNVKWEKAGRKAHKPIHTTAAQ